MTFDRRSQSTIFSPLIIFDDDSTDDDSTSNILTVTQLSSLNDIQKEIDAIFKKKTHAQVAIILVKLKAKKALRFSDMSNRTRESNALTIEKFLRIANSIKYSEVNQKSLDTFLRECRRIFDQKSLIYQMKLTRVLYAENYLIDTSVDE
jgi:hypothetical protein